ncbi:MAG TPA: hypothetical protein V6D25_01925 [Leptolyngbyaceae cyanobacterium]
MRNGTTKIYLRSPTQGARGVHAIVVKRLYLYRASLLLLPVRYTLPQRG